ncbi:MAG TPA: hypothetical protein VFG59_10430 [Anaeromyxobacter sp.]|nr:hypothetical protein [Anaeromyxobacter sp.]
MARRPAAGPSSHGLREYALVTAFLALALAGVLILFGDEIRGALGLNRAPPPASPPSEQR